MRVVAEVLGIMLVLLGAYFGGKAILSGWRAPRSNDTHTPNMDDLMKARLNDFVKSKEEEK